ncbi:hypothetical protein K0T92_17770 [Paenibacillus oenotherae]|uniref:FlxA-like protein n=1 Tax=Paenibacillus oenotherae TaxID=1435645 RepID=A0ABS7D9E1_9BACL|nr:hypothetical protein [Paenibacillus oenotherae]MBW7476569.1 hypothetical protein [Paenibacillus oenotherae]
MNISSASSSDYSVGASAGSAEAYSGGEGSISQIEAKIRQLQKQKAVVLNKIAKVAVGSESEEIKKKQIEVLRMEVAGIDLQIQMLTAKLMEMMKKAAEAKKPLTAPSNGNDPALSNHNNNEKGKSSSHIIDIFV